MADMAQTIFSLKSILLSENISLDFIFSMGLSRM